MSAPALQASDDVVLGFARAQEGQDARPGISNSPAFSELSVIPGLRDLWAETLGDRSVSIAILDGPVDLTHPALHGADLLQLESLVSGEPDAGPASQHGTHVASILFGQHDSSLFGIAPRCRGLSIPIFASVDADTFQVCSQIDLARALSLAVQHGANVINISGGELSLTGAAYPLLENAVRECARAGVLIVAAAGNQGCECLHIPASLDPVLAVGGMDFRGVPLDFSNWGGTYRARGPPGARRGHPRRVPGGGITRRTGTSYAAPIVTGVAALLLSSARRGLGLDSARVREALLASASGCATQPVPDCRRLLAGRLNVRGAVSLITGSSIHHGSARCDPDRRHRAGPNRPGPVAGAGRRSRPLRQSNRRRAQAGARAVPRSEEAPAPKTCGCGGKGAATAPSSSTPSASSITTS